MFLLSLFILAGIMLAVLLVAKRIEEKKRREVFILKLISKGDAHIRELHHQAVGLYSVGKDRFEFLLKKQIPMKSKSSLNKFVDKIEISTRAYLENLRDSRLLKRSEGISDFYKSMSEVEKGGGEIAETLQLERNEDIYIGASEIESPVEIKFEILEPVISNAAPTSIPDESNPVVEKVKKPRAKRTPSVLTKRRIKVVSEESY